MIPDRKAVVVEELRRHARMRHPQGRAFYGSCLCDEWEGPNTQYSEHVAEAIVSELEDADV